MSIHAAAQVAKKKAKSKHNNSGKKHNHGKKNKSSAADKSVIGSAITTQSPSVVATSTPKPRFTIISGTLTPSAQPTTAPVTVPTVSVDTDAGVATTVATVTIVKTVPTVAVDGSSDATNAPSKKPKHKDPKGMCLLKLINKCL